MSYSLGNWDQLIPQSTGAGPQTYRYVTGQVRNMPAGTAPSLVTDRVGLYLDNNGMEYWNVAWGDGGTLVLQYRARQGTGAYGSGVERRRAVEGALQLAAQSIGPNVSFDTSGSVSPVSKLPWILGGLAVAVGGLMVFAMGASAEQARRGHVAANRRRRR